MPTRERSERAYEPSEARRAHERRRREPTSREAVSQLGAKPRAHGHVIRAGCFIEEKT
jgi:hypothetical protein